MAGDRHTDIVYKSFHFCAFFGKEFREEASNGLGKIGIKDKNSWFF